MENDLKGRIDRILLVSLNLAWGFMTEKYGLPETRPENPYHETEQHLTIDKNGLVRFNTFFIDGHLSSSAVCLTICMRSLTVAIHHTRSRTGQPGIWPLPISWVRSTNTRE